MAHGTINHLALTVSDLARSAQFYDAVLGFLGYGRVQVPESTQLLMKPNLLAWASPNSSITLRPAKEESVSKMHDRTAPGLNHVAFNADNTEEVEGLHNLLKEIGASILDPPAEYPYSPGYYAVYFADPDGLKFEVRFLATVLECNRHKSKLSFQNVDRPIVEQLGRGLMPPLTQALFGSS